MNKALAFAARNQKELLRDPLNLMFALGFPLTVLFLLTMIQRNIPQTVFPIETLAPGIPVFGLSFVALFSGILISKDRGESFLIRLFASPLSSSGFLFGYIMPLIPLSLAQCAVCLITSLFLGLPFTWRLFLVLLVQLPCILFFIGIGLLVGTLLTDKQVGGICGALLTNLTAWLSGIWFDLNLVGGGFKAAAYALPFAHAVDASKAALAGDYHTLFPHLLWVIGYAVLVIILAITIFKQKMRNATL